MTIEVSSPPLVSKDLTLINSVFPYLDVNWNILTWKIATLPYPTIGQYSPSTKTIKLDVNHVHDRAVRFHELGHFIHDVALNYKLILFSTYDKHSPKEQFALAFEDTMLRIVNKSKMQEHNLKIYSIIKEVV